MTLFLGKVCGRLLGISSRKFSLFHHHCSRKEPTDNQKHLHVHTSFKFWHVNRSWEMLYFFLSFYLLISSSYLGQRTCLIHLKKKTFYCILKYRWLTCCDSFRWNSEGDSAIHACVFILPQVPLPSRLPHNIEQTSMCCIVVPSWLSILNIAVCTCPPNFQTIPSLVYSPGNHKFDL